MPEVVDVQAAALCRDSGILAKPVEDVAHVVVPDGVPSHFANRGASGSTGIPAFLLHRRNSSSFLATVRLYGTSLVL